MVGNTKTEGEPTNQKVATLEAIGRRRISAIIRTRSRQSAHDAMTAAVAGGFRMIEFTLTTPGALELISEFSENRDLLVGAGTVLTVDDARRAVDAGARFLVSPVCDAEVVAEAKILGAASVPGTFTATEMLAADRLGADLVKLFPAPADVPGYVRAILGPLPHLRIFPTAGVTPENFLTVLRAGAFGVGFVASLFDPAEIAGSDFRAIERRATDIHRHLVSL